jgi:hypothetical protein
MLRSAPLLLLLVLSCRTAAPPLAGKAFWDALAPHCGQAYEGRVVEGTEASDAPFREQRLIMHVRSCNESEIRIPFIAGENRSRTWVLTRLPDAIRLKHDHRHEDGTADRVTQYGGDTRAGDDDLTLEFFADEHTAALIPAARTNIWTMSITPGQSFTYALRRDESGRRFRVDFDLTRSVPAPPPPW